MLVFIAGAISTFPVVAITVVVNISSAIPFATFPITLAVAGAIKNTSAFLLMIYVLHPKFLVLQTYHLQHNFDLVIGKLKV